MFSDEKMSYEKFRSRLVGIDTPAAVPVTINVPTLFVITTVPRTRTISTNKIMETLFWSFIALLVISIIAWLIVLQLTKKNNSVS